MTDLTPARLEEIASLTREDIDANAIVRTHRVMAALHLSPALAARVIELEAALRAIAAHGDNCGCHQATFVNIARTALETPNAE